MSQVTVRLAILPGNRTINDSGPLTFRGTSSFTGSGEIRIITAAPVTLSGATSFTGAGLILAEEEDSVAGDLYNALLPIAEPYDRERGYPLLAYVRGIGSMFQPLADIVDEPEKLVDPKRTPASWLPWLGQFTGAGIPEGGSGNEAADRAAVSNPPKIRRGTVPAILEEVRARLTGTQTVFFNERGVGGSAWRGNITVLQSELKVGVTKDSLQAVVNAVKPSVVIIDVFISCPRTRPTTRR
jgi:hypothetical protein